MNSTIQILTLLNSQGRKFELSIESWTYQFTPEKWKRFQVGQSRFYEYEKVAEGLDGEFAVFRMPDHLSLQLMNFALNQKSNQQEDFSTASIKIDLYGISGRKTITNNYIINFTGITVKSLAKIKGKDKITFSFESTNIPKIPSFFELAVRIGLVRF